MARHLVINQPVGGSVGAAIKYQLQQHQWTTFRSAVAFAKSSGVKHLAEDLHSFTKRSGNDVRVTVGISGQITSLEGLQNLWRLLHGKGTLYVFEEGLSNSIFHPKIYFFRNDCKAHLISGSNNLTENGLYLNQEFATETSFDLSDPDDISFIDAVETALDYWQSPSASCRIVNEELLGQMHRLGQLPTELSARIADRQRKALLLPQTSEEKIFKICRTPSKPPQALPFPDDVPAPPVTPAPTVHAIPLASTRSQQGGSPNGANEHTASDGPFAALLMEVRPRSANGEVLLSKRAINEDHEFFGYPFSGWTVPTRAQPYPRASPDPLVDIIIYDASGKVIIHKSQHELTLWDYERKGEVRITLPDNIQDHIPDMSLLIMTRSPTPVLDYRLEFVPPGSARKLELEKFLTIRLPSGGAAGSRRYGWIGGSAG